MLLEASAPADKRALRGWTKERELFLAFKEHCAPVNDVRVEDLTGAPSALAMILYEHSDLRGTPDVLQEALKLRDSPSGSRYRTWFQELRRAWALGQRPQGEEDARDVLAELRRRSGMDADAMGGVKADITLRTGEKGPEGEITFKDVPVSLAPLATWLGGLVPAFQTAPTILAPSQLGTGPIRGHYSALAASLERHVMGMFAAA